MSLATPAHRIVGRISASLAEAVERASIVPLSIEQYQQMIESGIVPEGHTVELLNGVLVRKDRGAMGDDSMGHTPLHALVVSLLTALAGRINSEQCHLQIQLPVACPPDSVPEPDAAIVRGGPRDYAARLPGPADVTCVIEVAHSSVDRDRDDKLPLYAAAGIAQYIIVNLQTNQLEVYSDPDPQSGQYRTKVTRERSDSVELQLPAGLLKVAAAEILP